MRWFLALLLCLGLAGPVWGQITTQTHSTIPSASSSFLPDLQSFLANEDAQRYRDMFADFVVSGGVISTGAGLTKTPTSLTAYANGFYLTETGSITFADAQTTHVIADSVTTGNLTGYTRVSGTHYLTSPSPEPSLPSGTIRIATVVTAGGAVTTVTDRRVRFAVGLTQGGLALDLSTAANGNLLIGNGAGFTVAPLTMGTGITQTLAAGSITLAAQGQSTWAVRNNHSAVLFSGSSLSMLADALVLRNSGNGLAVVHNPSTLTNLITTSGPAANGRDQSGTFSANSWVHFYWIWNGTTLATVSSATAPPTGPAFPTGYTFQAYCCAIQTDNSQLLTPTYCYGAWCSYATRSLALSAASTTAETSVSLTASVPPNAQEVRFNGQAEIQGDGIAAADVTFTLRVKSAVDYYAGRLRVTSAGHWNSDSFMLTVPNVNRNVYYIWAYSSNVTTNALSLWVTGYRVGVGP